jgi:hypothetical protein
MKKKIFVLLVVILVISVMSIPAFAGPPDVAEGRWCYEVIDDELQKISDDGNVFYNMDDNGAWLGTFEGYSSDDGSLIVHPSGYYALLKSTVSFEGTVLGEYGRLEMRVNGWIPMSALVVGDFSQYEGTWVITRATGDLRGLVGQGTWRGVEEDNGECLAIGEQFNYSTPYSGNIHFENK